MAYTDLIKVEKLPTPWCAGCGIGILMNKTVRVMDKLGMNSSNTVIVSGIGCTGRAAGFFNMDSFHGCHGRALPLAEGIKRTNKKLNVIVFSGDGDIVGIGGNHLIHTARRNVNITVICNNNEIYGMTGGQMSPTTRIGARTLTSPDGNVFPPMNIQKLMTANKKHFYARSTVFHVIHLEQCIEQALKWDGFSFVDVVSDCITNYGRRIGFKEPYDMIQSYKAFKIVKDSAELKDDEIGILKNLGIQNGI